LLLIGNNHSTQALVQEAQAMPGAAQSVSPLSTVKTTRWDLMKGLKNTAKIKKTTINNTAFFNEIRIIKVTPCNR